MTKDKVEKNQTELKRQASFPWRRSEYHKTYNSILAQYKIKSCLEFCRGKSLLDLACGDGMMTRQFKGTFNTIVGVDASESHILEARKTAPDIEFHVSLIEEFETENKFDTVLMLDVLEHVVDPVMTLKKVAGFLAEEGILIIHVPNANAINRKLAVLMGTLESCGELSPFDLEIAGHRRSYHMESFANDIAAAGLDVIHTGGIFYKMLSTAQMDWFLENGLWEEGGFGWGRVGAEKRDWRAEFCRASYELGLERPEDCNIIFACAILKKTK